MKTLEVQTVEPSQTALVRHNGEQPEPRGITPAQAKTDAIAALTMKAYEKASQLLLTPEEVKGLAAEFPDEAFKPGAAGKEHLIYIEHAFLRDRLNSVFGPGQWALIPRNRWAEEFVLPARKDKPETHGSRIYVEAMLMIRGCFVSESVGAMEYYPSNNSQNYGDAVEGAKTAALRRCCKELGIGLQAWKKDFGDGWWQRQRSGQRNSNTRGMTGGNHNLDQSAKSASVPGASGRKAEVSGDQFQRQTASPQQPARTVPPTGKCATVEQRDRMIEELLRLYPQDDLLTYARAKSILMPSESGEGLGDWPRRFVPSMKSQMDLLLADLTDFFEGAGSDKPPFTNPEPPEVKPAKVNGKPAEVPRDQGVGTWRQVEVPFGKNKGKPLGQLDNRQLRAYAQLALEDVASPTFTGRDGKEHQKSPTALAKAKEWLQHLQAAAAEMGFTVGGDE